MTWKPDYAELDAVKDALRIETADTADDAVIGRAITAASRAIDDHCDRQFGKVDAPELRTYAIKPSGGLFGARSVVMIDDLMSLTGLVLQVDGVDITPTRWFPLNAAQKGEPWTRVYLPSWPCGTIAAYADITAPWGWTEIPDTIVSATILQASRLTKRRDSPFGVAGSPELGSELRLLAKVDPDVAVMLNGYVKRGTVA